MGGMRKLRRQLQASGNLPVPMPKPEMPKVMGDKAQARLMASRAITKIEAELRDHREKGGADWTPTPRDRWIAQTLAAHHRDLGLEPNPDHELPQARLEGESPAVDL